MRKTYIGIYAYICMVKVISLSNEAYEKLKALKGGRSFSEVVIELSENRKKKSLADFYGIWKDNTDEWEKIKNKIYDDRKKFKLREVRL